MLIALVTCAAFLPTLENQFVSWDDHKTLLDNPHYRGLGWPQLRWMWTRVHMGLYLPLTWMTFGLDYLLWGMQPRGYHLTSLLLHAANAVVFYLVALRVLSLARPGSVERGGTGLTISAAGSALLFALHPLRVESVAWATERRDVLSGLFYLLTILAYLQASERERRGRWWFAASVVLFICALLSKATTVSIPAVLLILDVYPLRRLGATTGWWGAAARRVYLEKIPFVLLAGGASTLAVLAMARIDNMASLDRLSVPGRLAVSAYGLSLYLWKTVAPFNLSPIYDMPTTVTPWATPYLLSFGVVLAITALAWILRRRVPGLPAAWLAYVVILLPMLGVVQHGPHIAADRYTYLACLSWALLVGAVLFSCWPRLPSLLTGVAACVLFALASLTWAQVQVWHDSQALWAHALAIEPNSPTAHNEAGVALDRQGKLAEAIEHYRQALGIRPHYAGAHNNWGVALARQGKLTEASEHFQQALRLRPDFADAHTNLGGALAEQGKLAEAIEHYQQALRLNPDNASAHYNWGLALARLGKPAEAIEHYRQALRLKPDDADAFNNWGAALARQGKLAEAIEHYQQAVRLKPDHAEAHTNWALALMQQGRMLEAMQHLRQALKVKPRGSPAQSDLFDPLFRQSMDDESVAPSQTGKRADQGPLRLR